MQYVNSFELQPLYDGRKSFYGKAIVERWDAQNGTRYALKSYGTEVATVTPVSATGDDMESYEVRVDLKYMTTTTLRHVKEFLAQTNGAFKGVTLSWLRKAVNTGMRIDGDTTESPCRKEYTLGRL